MRMMRVHCTGIDTLHHTCIMQNARTRTHVVFTGQAHHKSLILFILHHAPFTADGCHFKTFGGKKPTMHFWDLYVVLNEKVNLWVSLWFYGVVFLFYFSYSVCIQYMGQSQNLSLFLPFVCNHSLWKMVWSFWHHVIVFLFLFLNQCFIVNALV